MPVPSKEQIIDAIKPVQDPEIRIGVVDLGLIYDVNVSDDGVVKVKMTMTTPACPYGEMLLSMVHHEVEILEGVTKVEMVLVWDPPWNPKDMCSDYAKDLLGIW
jgi:metal-sulfur cluster biosynthetic enzyme